MLQDDDEGTADTVKAKLDTYAEVSPTTTRSSVLRWFGACLSFVCVRVFSGRSIET